MTVMNGEDLRLLWDEHFYIFDRCHLSLGDLAATPGSLVFLIFELGLTGSKRNKLCDVSFVLPCSKPCKPFQEHFGTLLC